MVSADWRKSLTKMIPISALRTAIRSYNSNTRVTSSAVRGLQCIHPILQLVISSVHRHSETGHSDCHPWIPSLITYAAYLPSVNEAQASGVNCMHSYKTGGDYGRHTAIICLLCRRDRRYWEMCSDENESGTGWRAALSQVWRLPRNCYSSLIPLIAVFLFINLLARHFWILLSHI